MSSLMLLLSGNRDFNSVAISLASDYAKSDFFLCESLSSLSYTLLSFSVNVGSVIKGIFKRNAVSFKVAANDPGLVMNWNLKILPPKPKSNVE